MELIIRTVIDTKGGYSQVVVSRDVFQAVNGFRPSMPYTTTRNSAGQGVRVFEFENGTLYARLDKETQRTIFVTTAEVAQKCLRTLEEERAGEPTLAFAF